MVLPILGHTYIPADQVFFGHFEGEMKRHEEIIQAQEYVHLMKKSGEVVRLGQDWKCYDLKAEVENILRSASALHKHLAMKEIQMAELWSEVVHVQQQHGYLKKLPKEGQNIGFYASKPIAKCHCYCRAKRC